MNALTSLYRTAYITLVKATSHPLFLTMSQGADDAVQLIGRLCNLS